MTSGMDLGRVHESSLPEEYATGRLSSEQTTPFEAHLVTCPECQDRVRLAERLWQGMHDVETAGGRAHRPRWATRGGWVLAAVASAAAVAAVWIGAQRVRSAEQALASERASLAHAETLLAEARAEVEKARRTAQVAPPPGGPVTRIPVLALVTIRGGQVPSVQLPPPGQPVALWIEREIPVRFERYHITVRSERGDAVWEDQVLPSSPEAVVLALDPGRVPAGTYVLTLEGEGRNGHPVVVSRHEFRTIPAPAR
jgi:hypothetical protein